MFFFFFKQKTAYEMCISDWSSDVCSSDLADVVFLDLEDAVAPDDKPQARKNVIQAINDIDWGTKTLSVRINGLDTHFMYRDVVDVIEQTAERLDLIMLTKVGTDRQSVV